MEKGEEVIDTINRKCAHYNWGGDDIYPSYPKEYGARCEFFDIFFVVRSGGGIFPDCTNCPENRTKEKK